MSLIISGGVKTSKEKVISFNSCISTAGNRSSSFASLMAFWITSYARLAYFDWRVPMQSLNNPFFLLREKFRACRWISSGNGLSQGRGWTFFSLCLTEWIASETSWWFSEAKGPSWNKFTDLSCWFRGWKWLRYVDYGYNLPRHQSVRYIVEPGSRLFWDVI